MGDTKNNKEELQKGVLNKYALVLVELKALGTRTFSYLIPDDLRNTIAIGQAVLVPFGRQKPIKGFVVGFSDYLPEHINAKYITKIIDDSKLFDIEYLKFLEWVANYYCCEIQDVIEAAVPMKFLEESQGGHKYEKFAEFKSFDNATKRQKQILEELQPLGKTRLIHFEDRHKTTRATMKKLAELACIEITEEAVNRNPLDIYKSNNLEELSKLSDEQENVYNEIAKKVDEKSTDPILIYGVTASGKTEVYFKLMKKVIDSGKNVLFLAPEIALASQLTQRLIKKFGTQIVAIWHSSISQGERYDVWERLKNDEIKILTGARSAIFAPLKNIGLIIIDEQHESTYKQTMPAPRYDARVVARKLAELNSATLVMGSATPDVCDYYEALNNGNLLKLEKRFNNAGLATVHSIDMRDEFYKGNTSIISKRLMDAIKNNLERGQQTIVLINRRGFSTSVQCQACGFIVECERCAIPMIYHKLTDNLKCHYCGFEREMPTICPDCKDKSIKGIGIGTQRIEQVLSKLFPDAKIDRMDSDVLGTKTGFVDVLDRFNNGEIDILVGTQMIAKGLDNSNVTLVAAVNADMSFNLPDYRAAERGFALLTQLAGRSGRGTIGGRVYFQSHNPDFHALETAQRQDYESFYQKEIEDRQEYDYPPYSKIIRVVLSGENKVRAEKSAMEIQMRLSDIVDKKSVGEYLIVLGPTPCVIERLHKEYRFQILIKNKLGDKGHFFMTSFLRTIQMPKDLKMVIDIDPVDIL